IDPKYDSVAKAFLIRDLSNRVTRLSFGDAVAKSRTLADDHQLARAIALLERNPTQAQLLATAGPLRK
ncbi:MAG: hypothetical protein ACREPM_06985, partial [Gemmatimonadaceae bacterium]